MVAEQEWEPIRNFTCLFMLLWRIYFNIINVCSDTPKIKSPTKQVNLPPISRERLLTENDTSVPQTPKTKGFFIFSHVLMRLILCVICLFVALKLVVKCLSILFESFNWFGFWQEFTKIINLLIKTSIAAVQRRICLLDVWCIDATY